MTNTVIKIYQIADMVATRSGQTKEERIFQVQNEIYEAMQQGALSLETYKEVYQVTKDMLR